GCGADRARRPGRSGPACRETPRGPHPAASPAPEDSPAPAALAPATPGSSTGASWCPSGYLDRPGSAARCLRVTACSILLGGSGGRRSDEVRTVLDGSLSPGRPGFPTPP